MHFPNGRDALANCSCWTASMGSWFQKRDYAPENKTSSALNILKQILGICLKPHKNKPMMLLANFDVLDSMETYNFFKKDHFHQSNIDTLLAQNLTSFKWMV